MLFRQLKTEENNYYGERIYSRKHFAIPPAENGRKQLLWKANLFKETFCYYASWKRKKTTIMVSESIKGNILLFRQLERKKAPITSRPAKLFMETFCHSASRNGRKQLPCKMVHGRHFARPPAGTEESNNCGKQNYYKCRYFAIPPAGTEETNHYEKSKTMETFCYSACRNEKYNHYEMIIYSWR